MDKADSKKQVTDEELKQLFRNSSHPVQTARDLAEQLPVTRQAIYARLGDLVDKGEVKRKKVGGAAVVYWLAEE